MAFKEWLQSKPHWLRGGIIGLLIVLPFFLLFWIMALMNIWNSGSLILTLPFAIPFLIISFIFGLPSLGANKADLIIPSLLVLVLYFAIGSLIGLLKK